MKSGGAELLVNNIKSHAVELTPSDKKWTIKELLPWIKENLLTKKPELFLQDDSV